MILITLIIQMSAYSAHTRARQALAIKRKKQRMVENKNDHDNSQWKSIKLSAIF
jgi:hypothetical protein